MELVHYSLGTGCSFSKNFWAWSCWVILYNSTYPYELLFFIWVSSLCYSFGFFVVIYSVVESVGEHVEEFTAGDTVLPVFLPNCNECSDCESQKSNICSIFENNFSPEMPRDGTSRFKDMNGEILHHFLWVSSFSEYTVVDVTHAVKITPEIPVDKACLLGCGVSTG